MARAATRRPEVWPLLGHRVVDLAVASTVAVVTGVVAVAVFAAAPRRATNQWLAFFLVLVSGNFATQSVNAWLDLLGAAGRLPLDRVVELRSIGTSLGFVLLAFDPAVLLYFASLFPRRGGIAERPLALGAVAAVTLLFLVAEVGWRRLSAPVGPFDPVRMAFFAWLAFGYALAAARILRALLAEPSSVMANQLRFVAFGILVATLPRVALVPMDLYGALYLTTRPFGPAAPATIEIVVRLALLAAGFAVAWRYVARARAPAERVAEARGVLRWTGAVFVAFAALWLAERVPRALLDGGVLVPAAFTDVMDNVSRGVPFAIRWFVFSAAMVVGIVRYQVLTVDADALASAGLGAGVVGAAVLVGGLSFLGPWTTGGAAVVTLAAAVAVARRIGRRPPATEQYLRERSLEVYRALVASALAEGPVEGARAAELERARRRLRVTPREHEVVLAIAQMEETGGAREVLLGRYAVLRRLGAGGHASVHLAKDRETGRLVVIKRIRDAWAGARGAADSALRELEVARRVSHANVVAVHDVVRTEDGAIVVMEFVDGGSLEDLLADGRRLPPERVADVLDQALAALEAVHEAGVVHGDLKPGNVLLGTNGMVKIADFGAARAVSTTRTLVRATDGAAPGTLLYMAPEVARGERATPQSDLYALGAVAFELLTGAPVVDAAGGPYEVLRRVVEPKAQRFPEGWETWLSRALATDPAARFRDAREMRDALPRPVRGATA